jgi:hypothetical protein
LDNPLHVILNNSKLAYRIYVILIANKELKKIKKDKQPNLNKEGFLQFDVPVKINNNSCSEIIFEATL